MPRKSDFSSTMRIDLTPGATEPSPVQTRKPQPQPPQPPKPKRDNAPDGKMVGSEDFQQLLQSVYDAAVITTLSGDIICGNERAVQFFLRDVNELAGLHITTLISGSDELLMATICESLENDRFILIQAYCARADGSVFPAEVSVNLMRIADRNYLSFFIRDVTLRKESEDRLRTGHTAIQNSGNGIAITDNTGTFEYVNPSMEILLTATSSDQLEDVPITTFLNDPGMGDTITETVVYAAQTWRGELEMVCLNDKVIFVQASVAPNRNADNEVVGMVWSLIDVSNQRRAQMALQEHNTQMEEDLSLAHEFQQAFIQHDYPTFPSGVSIAESAVSLGHLYLPSGAVGGDFFEVFSVSENHVGIFISDVMGHGVRSALVVATIRGLIEELGSLRDDPAAFLSHMNRDLTRIIHHGQVTFATAFYMVLDLTTGAIAYASAGHPAPFLLRSDPVKLEQLNPRRGKPGPALGLFGSTVYEKTTTTIEPDDSIVLYTDGIFEAECDSNCKCFEIERVGDVIRDQAGCEPDEMLAGLLECAQTFCEREHFDDDVCLIGLKLRRLLTDA